MSSSTQKRQANRINAQRSTGPRSSGGKRSSSLNALRHGLCLPIEQTSQAPIIGKLRAIIEAEGIDAELAKELATSILEYERNIAYQHQRLLPKDAPPHPPPPPTVEETIALVKLMYPEWEMLDDYLEEELFFKGKVSKRTLRSFNSMKKRMIKNWFSMQPKFKLRKPSKVDHSLRYLRRSSNQLLKSLRAAVA